MHPHLAQLAAHDSVEKVVYVSIETTSCEDYTEESGKVEHRPIEVRGYPKGLTSRVRDHLMVRKSVLDVTRELRPDFVICRGAQAGALGYEAWKKYTVPYYVESFEPHAEYMAEAGIWRRFGLRYLVQRNWEHRIKQTATGLITVSEAYANYLAEQERISTDRLRTVPCWVDSASFRFDEAARRRLRSKLGLTDALACVYLGQFGGLYYGPEAVNSLRIIRDTARQPVHFLLLSPTDRAFVEAAMRQHGLRNSDYSLLYVDHADVPGYLSAADFAISFHRSIPMAFAFSPIKYGEYWSCGLPVIAPVRVGDDHEWINSDGLGSTADFTDEASIRQATGKVLRIVDSPGYRAEVRAKGTARRNKERLVTVYNDIIGQY